MFPASRAENARFPEDCLPPERSYESRDALFRSINTWAATRGYAFTTGKSTRGKSGRQTVTYACDRSCHPPSASIERQRKTATRGTGCEFSLLAKESLDKSTWTVRHRPDKRFSKHNHAPSQHPSAHPAHRKLGEEVVADLSRLSHAGIAPRDIRTYIRQNCDSLVTQQDIYNGIAATRREVCEGQSSIHALASQLDKEGFWSRIQFDEDGRVTAVLFAHPDSLAYLQAYPDILLLDCTYKTNKHGMPLLDMIGVDACQRSFCIAFAFLSGETEDDFLWALDRLRSLYEHHSARLPSVILTDRCVACMNAVEISFPTSCSLLCRWHANKAVLRYCRPAFVRQDQPGSTDPATNDTVETSGWSEFYQFWHSIMGAPNEEEFKHRVSQFEKKYLPDYLEQVGYVQTFWLEQYKEKLVKAWVDQHAHFGNTATSRVEGIHALMKSHLRKSTLDLFEAWRAMKHALLNQLSELRSNQARQQIRVPIELSGPLYAAVHGWVSHEALRKVEEQRKLLSRKDPPPPLTCTGSFTRSHGLPCLHTLKSLQEQGQVLSLEHFHQHWRLQRKGAPQPLLEPRQRIEPTFTHSIIPKQSTRREPSAFESVEMARKAPPTCSRCHAVGHTRTARACPMRFGELLQQQALAPGLSQSVEVPVAEPEPPQIRPLMDVSEEELASAPEDGLLAAVVDDQPETVTWALQNSTGGASQRPGSPVHEPSPLPGPPSLSPPRYDSPQAIYGRYVAARSAWYAAQPAGSIKTNQQYRRAMGLPLRYDKQSYEWCLDYKQMSKRCTTSAGSREWTKEEMMAYLDWTKAEDERIESQVTEEMGDNPLANRRRGVKDIWRRIETDSREQEVLHSASRRTEECIIVGSYGR